MCQFITAILPNDADAAEVAAAFRRHGRACTAYVNATLAAQIGSAESTYCTTPGHCDCGTLLGSAVIEAVADDRDGDDAPIPAESKPRGCDAKVGANRKSNAR